MGHIDGDRFAKGMTYQEFKASMTRNQDRFAENERLVEVSAADLGPFTSRRAHVMALAADWCGDVVANLPILGVISERSGLDVRIFERDANPDLMDQYLNQGKYRSIPVFAFFDESWKELGVFIERPATVTAERAKRREQIFAAHPEFGPPDGPVDQLPDEVRARLQDELQKMREDTRKFANAEVIRELRGIVEGGFARRGAGQEAGAGQAPA